MATLIQDVGGKALLGPLTGSLGSLSGGRTAVLFSGGLDSSLLAALARPLADVRLYTVGYAGSHDLEAGMIGSEEMGLPWTPIMMDDASLRAAVVDLRERANITDPVVISFEAPLQIACAMVPETVLLSGQGADELFGGYARYSSMSADQLAVARREDLDRLLAEGHPREVRIAERFGKRLLCPYLDPMVVAAAMSIPTSDLIGDLGNKQPLRRLAADLGLTAARAPKKAAQYGSGAMKAMRRMAAVQGMDVRRWASEVKG